MKERPDLSFPLAPDVEADTLAARQRTTPVSQGGTSLRPEHTDSVTNVNDFEWPESGPSGLPIEEKEQAKNIGPFGAKALASMTGAVAVSLLMTPFDVVKTRLQTVQPPPRLRNFPIPTPGDDCCQTSLLSQPKPSQTNPLTCYTSATAATADQPAKSLSQAHRAASVSFSSLRPAATPAAPPSGCLHPSKWAGIWGEAVTLEEALARGLARMNGGGGGTLVVPQGSGVLSGMMGGFWGEIATVRRETGVRGLWKGVGTTITMSIPSAAIYMLGYEYLLARISPMFTGTSDPAANHSSLSRTTTPGVTASLTPAPLVAGSLARTISATVISPIEMFRTRLQALPGSDRISPTYASTSKDMVKLVQTKGMHILWRGLGPTLWRDVPFSGLYWAGFEILKTHFTATRPDLSPLTTSFISGALSGTFSALLTQPFDVLKTRRQVFTPSPNCSPAALNSHASTIPLAMHVIRTEGFSALMAGLTARCGKVAPACGLMIASYEGVGKWLSGGAKAL